MPLNTTIWLIQLNPVTLVYPNDGYIIEAQVLGPEGKSEYIIIQHVNHSQNLVMIMELKHPNMLHTGSEQATLMDIQDYVEQRFVDTCHNVLYGLAGVGITWSVWKMERGGIYAN